MKVIREDLKGYYGMNSEALNSLKKNDKNLKDVHLKPHEIIIAKHLPKNLPIKEVKKHEDEEWDKMHFKHWNYKKADKFATKHERD